MAVKRKDVLNIDNLIEHVKDSTVFMNTILFCDLRAVVKRSLQEDHGMLFASILEKLKPIKLQQLSSLNHQLESHVFSTLNASERILTIFAPHCRRRLW